MTSSSTSTFFGLDLSELEARWISFRRKVSQRYLLLEFRNDSLLFSEAHFHNAKINFSNVGIQSLPEGSVELGVPVEPLKMSGLLHQLCKEKGISVHRCAVVLPPESSFVSVVRLPSSLSVEEAWDFAQSPDSGLQIPIPLQQTDFDLIPLQHLWKSDQLTSPYVLSGIPSTLVDSLIATLNLAGLELCDLSLAMTAKARLLCSQIVSLDSNSYVLLLEFYPECTNALILSTSGPVSVSRLAAIREFPEPEVSDSILGSALDQSLAAETMIVAEDSYLPISELDLKVLVRETKDLIFDFKSKNVGCLLDRIYLTGSGSCHPGLESLLKNALEVPVSLFRVSDASGIGTISMDSLLLPQSLGRLLGLGLHLIPDNILLQSAKFDFGQSVSPSPEPIKVPPLFNNPWLLTTPSNPWLLAGPSSDELNEATSIYTPQHSVDQTTNSEPLSSDSRDSTAASNPCSPSSDLHREESALNPGSELLDLSQSSEANVSHIIDMITPDPSSRAEMLESQFTSIKSGTDDFSLNIKFDSVDPSILQQESQEHELLSSSYIDHQVDSSTYALDSPASIESLSESNDSQAWPSINEDTLLPEDKQQSIPSKHELLEDIRDVKESEMSDVCLEKSEPSDKNELSRDSEDLPSIMQFDGSASATEAMISSDGSDQEFYILKLEDLERPSESQNLSSDDQLSWPSIRQIESNDKELEGSQSTDPDVSLNESSSKDSQSSFLSSPDSSEDYTCELNITTDTPVTHQSVLSELEPQGEDEEGFGELRFSDD